MSDPALDLQVHIALRDSRIGEEFAERIAELTAEIANATFKFSQDVKSAYEPLPKRRLSDKNFDQVEEARLTFGAFSFFMYVLDRYLLRIETRVLKQTVLDFIFENVARVYAKSFSNSPAETNRFISNHYDRRVLRLGEAPTIFGEGPEDKKSATWRASRAICEEDLGRDDHRLLVIVATCLRQGFESLALADRIAAMAVLLRLPMDLRKIA